MKVSTKIRLRMVVLGPCCKMLLKRFSLLAAFWRVRQDRNERSCCAIVVAASLAEHWPGCCRGSQRLLSKVLSSLECSGHSICPSISKHAECWLWGPKRPNLKVQISLITQGDAGSFFGNQLTHMINGWLQFVIEFRFYCCSQAIAKASLFTRNSHPFVNACLLVKKTYFLLFYSYKMRKFYELLYDIPGTVSAIDEFANGNETLKR